MSEDIAKSAYRYVPISAAVYFPAWADEASHDRPFADGISGTIDVAIETETPLLVAKDGDRDAGGPPARHFVEIGGRTAIPGSAIRGMLRNVVEIASFGKLGQWVTDRRLSYRDLQNEKNYIRFFTEDVAGGYRSRSRAAWLEVAADGSWQLRPCQYARVKITALEEYRKRPIDLRSRQGGPDKYAKWGMRPEDLRIRFTPSEEEKQVDDGGLIFRAARDLGDKGITEGVLVFTGQAAAFGERNAKKREFIFFDEGTPEPLIPISREKQREFEWIHSQGERHGEPEPNREWTMFKQWLRSGRRVPVFYLEDSPVGLAFGLAQLFRLPYAHSIHDAIRNTSPDHLDPRPDLAETIFGRVRPDPGGALKGRVSIEPCWFVPPSGGPTKPGTERYSAVLMGPRASFYPYTLAQPDASDGTVPFIRNEGKPTPHYKTFVDEDVELAGWKRYPLHDPIPSAGSLPAANDRIVSVLHPVKKGTRFEGRIHLHNVRPQEIGALLWAITWGDPSGRGPHRHSLGMGKPLGFGRIRLSIVRHDLDRVAGGQVAEADIEPLIDAFTSAMEEALGGTWAKSEQIFHLLSLATPVGAGNRLTHPVLDGRRNDFKNIKKQGKVLQPTRPFTGKPDRLLRPRPTAADRRRARKREEEAREQEEIRRLEAAAHEAAELDEARRRALPPAIRFADASSGVDTGKAWEMLRNESAVCRTAAERKDLHAAALLHADLRAQIADWQAEEPTTPKAGSGEYHELPPKKQKKADKLHRNLEFLRRLERGDAGE